MEQMWQCKRNEVSELRIGESAVEVESWLTPPRYGWAEESQERRGEEWSFGEAEHLEMKGEREVFRCN